MVGHATDDVRLGGAGCVVAFFIAVFLLFGVDEARSNIVLTLAFLPVVYGS